MAFVHDRSENVPGGVTKKQNENPGAELLEMLQKCLNFMLSGKR